MDVNFASVLTIVGWLATAVTGFLGGLALARAIREKKKITWAVLNEVDLLSVETAKEYDVDIKVMVNGLERNRISSVSVAIKNAGNREIIKPEMRMSANEAAIIHFIRPASDLGKYQDKLDVATSANVVVINAEYMNVSQALKFELLISNYEIGSLAIDVAEAGVHCEQVSGASRGAEFLQSISFSLGQHSEAMAQALYLGREIALLRRALESVVRKKGDSGDG